MLSQADRDQIAANSAEIIGGTGETILRKRLDTSVRPASFDEDFGEVGVKAEETYLELTLTGKVLELTDKLMLTDFGGSIEADADVHLPFASDVATGDFFVIREQWYTVGPVKESALKSYLACAVTKIKARTGGSEPAPVGRGREFGTTVTEDFAAGVVDETAGEFDLIGNAVEVPAEAGHPGIVALSADSGVAALSCSSFYSRDVLTLRAIVRPTVGTSGLAVQVGLVQDFTVGSEGARGVYFSFAPGESPNWRSVAGDIEGASVVSSEVEYELDRWYLLEIVRSAAGFKYYIDGSLVAELTTHVPMESLYPAIVLASAAEEKVIHVDFMALVSGHE